MVNMESGFKYDSRVASALAPALFFVAGNGGAGSLWPLTFGAMLTHALDAANLPGAALLSVWFTFLIAALGGIIAGSGAGMHYAGSWALPILMQLSAGSVYFLTAVWASLQFRWLHTRHPDVSRAAERLLFSAAPSTSACVQIFSISTATDSAAISPFLLMALSAFYYTVFALPKTSSFLVKSKGTRGGAGSSDSFILTATESALQAGFVLLGPALLYMVLHAPTLTMHSKHLWSMLLLLSLPPLLLCVLSQHQALWWLGLPQESLDALVWSLASVALVLFVPGLEGRVVFHSFGRFIPLLFPWNWLLVTVALYGGLVLVIGHFLGAIGNFVGGPVAMAVLVMSALAASLAAGAPLWVLPAPLLAAAGLAQFYSTCEMRDYLFFVAGSTITFAWFLSHHFWFIDTVVGGLALRDLCTVLVVGLGLALSVPGLIRERAPRFLTAAFLLAQAALLASLEDRLYNVDHEEEEGLYPAYLIVLTTVVGVMFSYHLKTIKVLNPFASWILSCIYGSKLMVLLLPGQHVLPSTFFISLASSLPYIIPTKSERGAQREEASSADIKVRGMSPATGFFCTAMVFVSLCLGRYLIYDLYVLFSDHRPTASMLLGVCLVWTGFVSLGLARRHFPMGQEGRRGAAMFLGSGMLLLLLQPPLPPSALALTWDQEHTLEVVEDDEAIYGSGPSPAGAWPTWLLILTTILPSAAAATNAPIMRTSFGLGLGGVVIGGGVGAYVAMEYFRSQGPLQLCVLAACVGTALTVIFLQRPSTHSPKWIPVVFAAVVALLPVSLLLHHDTTVQAGGGPGGRKGGGGGEHEAALLAEAVRSTTLAFFMCIFALQAFAIKLKVNALLQENPKSSKRLRGSAAVAGAQARPAHLRSLSSALWAKQLASYASAHLPPLGNTATSLCVCLALLLNHRLNDDSPLAIFAVAPLTLLLNQDLYLFAGIGDKRRYFPLAAAVGIYLTVLSGGFLLRTIIYGSYVLHNSRLQWAFILKNLAALAFTLPVQYIFNKFLWDGARVSDLVIMCFAPLNLPPMLLADSLSTQLLAGVSLLEAIVQYFMSRHVRRTGLKYI